MTNSGKLKRVLATLYAWLGLGLAEGVCVTAFIIHPARLQALVAGRNEAEHPRPTNPRATRSQM
jgi:hypothetical protein